MTKIPAWRMKELKKEYAKTLRVIKSMKETLVEMELPAWRKKELKKEIALKTRSAASINELIEAGVYGA